MRRLASPEYAHGATGTLKVLSWRVPPPVPIEPWGKPIDPDAVQAALARIVGEL